MLALAFLPASFIKEFARFFIMALPSHLQTLRRAAIWLGLAVFLFLIWRARNAFLLVFAAYLVSLLLRLLATLLARATRLPRLGALAVAVIVVFGVAFGSFWLCGSNMISQLDNILARAHQGYAQLASFLGQHDLDIASFGRGITSAVTAQTMLGFFLHAAEITVILLIMAIYLAAEPELYHHGIAILFPNTIRDLAVEAVDALGSWLELWMLGQLCVMAIVGLGSYVALLLLGVSNAGALGLIAGLTEAVPYLGPFIGAVPALLVALTQSPMLVLWTAAAYLVLHLIEGYVLGPALQWRIARVPPIVILSGIFTCQLIFGFVGLVLAAPMTVALYAAAKVLYLHDTLRQPVELPAAPKLDP